MIPARTLKLSNERLVHYLNGPPLGDIKYWKRLVLGFAILYGVKDITKDHLNAKTSSSPEKQVIWSKV